MGARSASVGAGAGARRGWAAWALVVGLLGCDADPAGVPTDAEPSADADATPPETPPLLAAHGWTLRLGPDDASAVLSDAAGQIVGTFTAAAVVATETVALLDLPEVGWTTEGERATGRFGGDPDRPGLVWTLRLTPAGLEATLTAVGAGARLPLTELHPLVGTLDPRWAEARRLPAEPGPWQVGPAPATRAHRQDLVGADGALRLSAAGGTVTVAGATVTAAVPAAVALDPGTELERGATLAWSAAWQPVPGASAVGPRAVGWASGAAYPTAASAALVAEAAAAVGAVFPTAETADALDPLSGAGARVVRLDGRFFAGPGDARALPPVAESTAALAAAAAPARLWLRWPARHAPGRLALFDTVPSAQAPDGPDCGAPACARLDPQAPAARDRSARAAAALAAAGVAGLWLDDSADLPADTWTTWASALLDAAPGVAWVAGDRRGPAVGFAAALVPVGAGVPAPPCAAAATTHPWPADCAASLGALEPQATVVAPPDDGALRALAFGLVAAEGADRDARVAPDLSWHGRAAARRRQAAALWLVAGGPLFLNDNLSNLLAFSDEDLRPLRGVLAAPSGGGAPLEPGDADPPARFAGPGYAVFVNWGDTPATWAPGPDLAVAAALAAGSPVASPGDAPPLPATARILDPFDPNRDPAGAPAPIPAAIAVPAHDAAVRWLAPDR